MQEDNIPFEKLELIGLGRHEYERLPQDFKDKLESGELTPIITTSSVHQNGIIVEFPMKLQKTEDEHGRQQLRVYPVFDEFGNDGGLAPKQFEALKKGGVIRDDGVYAQRDPETNCVLTMSEQKMQTEKKLKDIEKLLDIELGSNQKNQIRNGKPVEVNVGDEPVTVGLDLKDPNGFRVLKGDLKEWEYQQKVIYDIQHPEYLGVVKTEENRWEFQQIVNSERYPKALRELVEKPKQAQNSGMKL